MKKVWELLYFEVKSDCSGPFLFLQRRIVDAYDELQGVSISFQADRDDPALWTATFEYENMKAYLAATDRRGQEVELSLLWNEFSNMLLRPAVRRTHFEDSLAA